ncbi:hypothetical protein K2173_001616 [Erythroxylum novogranatense]|uniref:Uncharacterized protein n=1 Tax=Erythroxylum novogranatense TaxID=1862640 RepID=A0AAV8T5L1_9ROSI|nr:hypothetical protein K2173_001616 [Erythroxylum novogranatense]
MQQQDQPVRFTSCRGVAFEATGRRANPFSVSKPNAVPLHHRMISNALFADLQGLSSKGSIHFCDLESDEEHQEDEFIFGRVGEGAESVSKEDASAPSIVPSAGSKRTEVARKQEPTSRLSIILLDQGLFTVYKRLFVVCFALNIICLALAAAGKLPYARSRPALFSIANILALTLCRSEAFLRVAFWLSVKIFGRSWVPLPIKTAITSLLQSVGGIHSGCGISSIAWMTYALVLTLIDRDNTSPAIIGVASTILSLLCRTHRFAGWAALGLLWAFIMLNISYDPNIKSYNGKLGSKLIKQHEFWLTVAITVLIIIPWATIGRVPVKISSPSGHASIIEFAGGVKPGILGRISPSPLSEWHAFGIISDGKTGHIMLAGAVGDFTKSLVSNPPSHLWVRRVHFAGLPYLVYACSCHLFCNQAELTGHPKDKVIVHDTAVLGRPNVSEMSVETAKNWGAQVVIVTSNPEGSRGVVNACKAAGIAAFGPIWDS